MHVALDDFIPFNEYFIVPYMMWFLYVAGTILYFLFTNREDYYRICIFLLDVYKRQLSCSFKTLFFIISADDHIHDICRIFAF